MHGDADMTVQAAFDDDLHQHAMQGDAQQLQSADPSDVVAIQGRPPDGGGISARTEPEKPAAGGLQPSGRPGSGLGHAMSWQPRLMGICRHTARVTDVAAEIEAGILGLR